jgi:hypothetical protein
MILQTSYGLLLLAENLMCLKRSSHLLNSFKLNFCKKVKTFQCDNDGEYNNELFQKYCTDHGLVFHFSCLHTSSQNGKAERKIRTINNMIRTMLAHSFVPPSYWHHALHMATYLLNIIPCKTFHNQSPT